MARTQPSARRSTTPTSAASCRTRRCSASLGCGNPTAVAELREGETVLDLGSGGGIDVILSAKRVGPTGRAYGARHDRRDAGARAAQRRRGRDRQRDLPQGRDRGGPAPGGLRGRRDLELRRQPLGRQAGSARRTGSRAAPGRAHRHQRHRRGGSTRECGASRARQLRGLHRGRPLPRRVRRRARGGGLRGGQRGLHPRGRGGHARRDRQGDEARGLDHG